MYALCRYLKSDGKSCRCPAIKGAHFCHNHREKRNRAAQIPPPPDPYGWDKKPLPLVPSEDRASIELNFHIVVTAFNHGHISVAKANAFNRLFRSCELNLTNGEREHSRQQSLALKQAEARNQKDWHDHADESGPHTETLREVVLTPEGEEIAPFQEVWEQNERHQSGPTCPCQKCAIKFRNPQQEQHHPNCNCTHCAKSENEERNNNEGAGAGAGAPCLAETWDQDASPTATPSHDVSTTTTASNDVILSEREARVEGSAVNDVSTPSNADKYDPLTDKTLFEGMTHKSPSIEFTYELYDRINKRHDEHEAKKQAREQTKAQPPAA